MFKKWNILQYCFLFLLFAFSQNVSAQSTNNHPWVKVVDRHLWVLSSDNVTYAPYFIKGVGYEPMPVGRYPSDWGYALTDPRSTRNNIFDDPDILNRDFSLLHRMNANTIRIWKGDNTSIHCACANNGRFPDYITNASTTANKDTTQNTLDLANQYGLKVIAGFWVNPIGFDANNNVVSTDENGNLITGPQIISRFVNYVNTFKGNRSILFWAIGNENNYQVLNPMSVSIAAFENVFGTGYGDSIFHWLQQVANIIDFNGNFILDFNSPDVMGKLRQQYPVDANSILNILNQFSGQKLTSRQLSAWYSLVDQMAYQAHLAEDPTLSAGGKNYHPVAMVNGEIGEIGQSSNGTTDAQMPNLDIWGTNVYRGKSFGSLFSDYEALSQKPLWISEYGIDAWSVSDATSINNWGLTLADDLHSRGASAPAVQAAWDLGLWNEIFMNSPVVIGGSMMEYSDEWWKPYEFYCTNPNASQSDNTKSSGVCNSNQKYFGSPFSAFPDDFMNQEWFGLMAIRPSPQVGAADIMTPRKVFNDLSTQWANVTVLNGMLVDTLTQQSLTDLTGPMLWNAPLPTAQGLYGGSVGVNALQFPNFRMVNLSNGDYQLQFNLQGHVINYHFTITPNSPYNYTNLKVPVPVVKSSAGAGGTISPFGVNFLSSGENQTFTVSTNDGYLIDRVLIDGQGLHLLSASAVSYSYTFANVTGAHTITASFKTSTPSVVLNSDSYIYTAPASVYLSAFTSEIGGAVRRVDFYNGTNLIGSSNVSSSSGSYKDFVYIWKNATPGNYSIVAKAYDGNNKTAVSGPTKFIIHGLPKVSLAVATPSLHPMTNITLTAAASESYGTIKQVEFFNGSTLLAKVTQGPYVFTIKKVSAGTYHFTAAAFDGSNNVVISSAVDVTIK